MGCSRRAVRVGSAASAGSARARAREAEMGRFHRFARAKWLVVGAILGVAVASATVALAGSGVGGIFNLGVNNTVDNAATKLTGTNSTASMLDVTNTSASGTNANGIVGRSSSGNASGLAGTNNAA